MANPSVQLQLSQSDTTERCSNSEIMQDALDGRFMLVEFRLGNDSCPPPGSHFNNQLWH